MAGHSKWANIKHKKAGVDKKRGKVFTKLLKEVTVAVKTGGGPDTDSNPRLRSAVQAAKRENIPKDTIEKAIKKAAGADSADIQEVTYEGYGSDGVAIFIECATDNSTRTVANIRSYFSKNGGSMGKDGCLQFIFDRKAIFSIPIGDLDEEEITMEVIDAGAEDVEIEDGRMVVTGSMEDFGNLQQKFADLSIEPEEGGLERVPAVFKQVNKETYEKIEKLIDVIEDDDDVQKVYHNIEFDESLISGE